MAPLLAFCLDCLSTTLTELVLLAYLFCRTTGGFPPLTPRFPSAVLSRVQQVWRRAKRNWPHDKKDLLDKEFLRRALPVLGYEVITSVAYPWYLRWQHGAIQPYTYARLPIMFLLMNIAMLIILIAGDEDTSSDHAPVVAPPPPGFARPLPVRPRVPQLPRPLLRTTKRLHPPARREPAQGAG